MTCGVRGYAICTTPRSGSSYLCQILSATGALGYPREYFNFAARRQPDMQSLPRDPVALAAWISTKSTTANQVYGLKLFPNQIDRLARHRWADSLPALKFVYFTRDDLLGQAISLARAEQTDAWRANEVTRRPPRYDREQIHLCVRRIAQAEARWLAYFARNGLSPLRLSYEALLASPQSAVNQICDLVDASGPIDWSKVDLAVQRDDQSAAWRARFLSEMADLNAMDRVGGGLPATVRRLTNLARNRLTRFRRGRAAKR